MDWHSKRRQIGEARLVFVSYALHLGVLFLHVLRPFQGHSFSWRGFNDRCVARHGRGRNGDGRSSTWRHRSYQYFVKLGFMAVGFEAVDGLAAANVVWLTQSVMLITMGALSYQMLYMYRMNRA